jgi:hypothetical protein
VSVTSKRRFCLLKRFAKRRQCLEEDVWIVKQAAEPGTALAADFPHRAALIAAGYSALEDLDGATTKELKRFARLSSQEADTVLAATAAALA